MCGIQLDGDVEFYEQLVPSRYICIVIFLVYMVISWMNSNSNIADFYSWKVVLGQRSQLPALCSVIWSGWYALKSKVPLSCTHENICQKVNWINMRAASFGHHLLAYGNNTCCNLSSPVRYPALPQTFAVTPFVFSPKCALWTWHSDEYEPDNIAIQGQLPSSKQKCLLALRFQKESRLCS